MKGQEGTGRINLRQEGTDRDRNINFETGRDFWVWETRRGWKGWKGKF